MCCEQPEIHTFIHDWAYFPDDALVFFFYRITHHLIYGTNSCVSCSYVTGINNLTPQMTLYICDGVVLRFCLPTLQEKLEV